MKAIFMKRIVEGKKWYSVRLRYSSIVYIDNHHMISLRVGSHILVIYFKPLKVIIKSLRYSLRKSLRSLKAKVIHNWKMRFSTAPVYYTLFTRDCDMCESTTFGKSKNYREHYNWLNDYERWDCEGSTSVNEIDKDEYDYYVDEPVVVRDRVMEAYENGRGCSTTV
jgi:hypothetical protein